MIINRKLVLNFSLNRSFNFANKYQQFWNTENGQNYDIFSPAQTLTSKRLWMT